MEEALEMGCKLNREYLPQNGGIVYLGIDLIPKATVEQRPTLNVCLLVDSSGSMEGEKIENAKRAAIRFVEGLESKDYIGVVTFDSEVHVTVEGQHVMENSVLKEKIEDISASGTTELYKGLKRAFEELKRPLHTVYASSKEPVKRVILLSDGRPTDEVPESQYAELAKEMRSLGISITSLGIGDDYNEDLLSEIANNSSGTWHHLKSPEGIHEIFSEELRSMETVLRVSPVLVLHSYTRVEMGDVFMVKPENCKILSENGFRYPLRDIKANEAQRLVAKLHLPPRPEMKEDEIEEMHVKVANVELREPGATGPPHIIASKDIIVKYTKNESLLSKESDAYPRSMFMSAETTLLAKRAMSDETLIKEAEDKVESILKDPDATKIREVTEQVTKVKDTLTKTKTGLSEDEKKRMKSEVTKVSR